MRATIGCVLLLLAGCAKTGSLAVVTVDTSALTGVHALGVKATAGGQTQDLSSALAGLSLSSSTEFAIRLPSDVTGTLTVNVTALDAQNAVFASGMSSATIDVGKRFDLPTIVLGPGGPDLGVADLPVDLNEDDLDNVDLETHPPVFTPKNVTIAGLYAVWGANPTHVWVSGHSSANTFESDGTDTWTQYSTNPFYDVNGLWGTTATHAWMVDDNGDIRIINSTGDQWAQGAQISGSPPFTAVWGTSNTNIWTVSAAVSGTAFIYHNTLGTNAVASWTSVHTDNFGYNAIHGVAADDFYVVGTGGNILRGDGTMAGFTYYSFGPTNLNGVFAVDATHVYVVGDAGAIGFSIGNGTFTAQTPPPSAIATNFHGVWASAVDDVYVIGDNGTLLHSTGNGVWTVVTSGAETPSGQSLTAIFGFGPDNIYITTSEGNVIHGK